MSGLQKASYKGPTSPDVSDLELLAHYELVDEGTGSARSGFAVLLELSDQRLMLEGDVPFGTGDELSLNFFLPDAGAAAGRAKVSLRCKIAGCRDPEQLQYSARVSRIGEASRRAIQKLHAERGSGGRE